MTASKGIYAENYNYKPKKSTRYKNNRGRKNSKRRRFLISAVLLLALLIFFKYLDSQMRPIVETVAGYQAKVAAVKSINDAFYSHAEEISLAYDDLVTLTYDDSGKIAAIETNIININKFKAAVTDVIINKIIDLKQISLEIAAGTLSGNQFLAGRGPSIPLKVVPVGFVTTQITSKFEEAGINQTRHEIILSVEATVSAIIPGYSVNVACPSNFIIAETIIVGTVPENYTNVITRDRELISDINDYSASANSD